MTELNTKLWRMSSADVPCSGAVSRLHPDEAKLVRGKPAQRVEEFAAGRLCAHRALAELGADVPVVGRDSDGVPVLPYGVIGSIAHSATRAVAVAGRCADVVALGIDTEPVQQLPQAVVDVVLTDADRDALPDVRLMDRAMAELLVFCAKEATYKAWFPGGRKMLDHDHLTVTVDPAGTFTSAVPDNGAAFDGVWTSEEGHVTTVAYQLP